MKSVALRLSTVILKTLFLAEFRRKDKICRLLQLQTHIYSEIIVEYFDSRGASLFQQQMDRQPLLGGELELRFIWDKLDSSVPPPPYVQ